MDTVTVLCCGFGHTTSGPSLFAAAARALDWFEVACRDFGTAFRPDDGEVLSVTVVGGETYRVRVGRVRQWQAAQARPLPGVL